MKNIEDIFKFPKLDMERKLSESEEIFYRKKAKELSKTIDKEIIKQIK